MRNSGQLSAAVVWTIVVMLAAVGIGGLLFGKLQTIAQEQSEGGRTIYTDNTANADFGDNESWENRVENMEQAWISNPTNENFVMYCEDNEPGATVPGTDNGILFQSVTISATEWDDGIDSATVVFKYCVVDNSNMDTIIIHAQLCNGTDNTTLYHENIMENAATFTSVENNIAALITSATTYTLYIRTEFQSVVDETENTEMTIGIVHYDDAKLMIKTYTKGIAENIAVGVGETGGTAFPLIMLLVLIGVFVAIITVLKLFA